MNTVIAIGTTLNNTSTLIPRRHAKKAGISLVLKAVYVNWRSTLVTPGHRMALSSPVVTSMKAIEHTLRHIIAVTIEDTWLLPGSYVIVDIDSRRYLVIVGHIARFTALLLATGFQYVDELEWSLPSRHWPLTICHWSRLHCYVISWNAVRWIGWLPMNNIAGWLAILAAGWLCRCWRLVEWLPDTSYYVTVTIYARPLSLLVHCCCRCCHYHWSTYVSYAGHVIVTTFNIRIA